MSALYPLRVMYIGWASMERLRKPIRGRLTQDWIYSHFFFKWQRPGSHWARPWPTCWCRTGDCPSLARPDDRTRPAYSTRPCGRACFGEWCRGPRLESEAVYPCDCQNLICKAWFVHIHAYTDRIPMNTYKYMHILTIPMNTYKYMHILTIFFWNIDLGV